MRTPLRPIVASFAAGTIVFLLLDAAWLTLMASRLYRPAIGHIMRDGFDVLAAAAFYAVYLTGMLVFVVRAVAGERAAFVRGAFFGLVCYGTYDLTNQATIVGWPWHVTLADLAWGAFVTGVSAWSAYRAGSRQRR